MKKKKTNQKIWISKLLRNHASDPGLINAVLQKIVELRAIGHRHQTQLDWYRRRWSLLVHLPPLFAEMFDIPRSEEDLAWNRNERVTSLFLPIFFFFCLLRISSKNRKDIQQQQNKISFLLFMIDIILSNLGLFKFQRFSITHPWILFLKSPPDKFERILWPAIVLRPIYWNWLIISFLLYLSVFLSIDFFLCIVHIIIYQIFKKEKKLWSTTIIWNFLLFSRVQTFRPFS